MLRFDIPMVAAHMVRRMPAHFTGRLRLLPRVRRLRVNYFQPFDRPRWAAPGIDCLCGELMEYVRDGVAPGIDYALYEYKGETHEIGIVRDDA